MRGVEETREETKGEEASSILPYWFILVAVEVMVMMMMMMMMKTRCFIVMSQNHEAL